MSASPMPCVCIVWKIAGEPYVYCPSMRCISFWDLNSVIRVIFGKKLILNVVHVLVNVRDYVYVYEHVHEHDLGCGRRPR